MRERDLRGDVQSLETEGITLRWDPALRLARLDLSSDSRASEAAARRLERALEAWTSESPLPYRLLVDTTGLPEVSPGWRAVFGDYFKRNRDRVRIAWFGAGPLVRVIILMFVKATGVTGAAFATEAEALAYLAEAEVAP